MIKIITTVGTSIITNFLDNNVQNVINNENSKIDDSYQKIVNGDSKPRHENHIKERISEFFLFNTKKNQDGTWYYNQATQGLNKNCCAEINSILKIKERKHQEEYKVYLICTDTSLSKISAELIKGCLETINLDCEIISVNGLQVENNTDFNQKGFQNLIETITSIKKSDFIMKKKPTYILNITGGYKGLIPLMTIYGLVGEHELVYIYDQSNSLISLKNIPLTFDWAIVDEVAPYLDNSTFYQVKNDQNVLKLLSNYGFLTSNNQISPFGELFRTIMDENIPEGKTSLGMLVEYKLAEFYSQFDKSIRNDYVITRGVYIDDMNKYTPGNEIDILMEIKGQDSICKAIWDDGQKAGQKPVNECYITNELKSFGQVCLGTKAIKQFENFLDQLNNHWANQLPKEIRYVVWTLKRNGLPAVEENNKRMLDTLFEMKRLVGVKLNNELLFKSYLLTLRIDPKKDNPYVDMMQRSINQNDFKLIQL